MQFSVVIPCYNGAPFVADALKSLFAQTVLPVEIIVVDDCSTDCTCEVVESLIVESPVPLRLIRLEKNSGGPSHPINVGVGAATGDYVTVLDQDDLFVPTRLETHAAALDAFPEASIAMSWCADLRDRDRVLQPPDVVSSILSLAEPKGAFYRFSSASLFRLLLGGDFIQWGYPFFSFRRSDWQRKGGVDESLALSSDLEFLLWLAGAAPGVLVDTIGYWRRFHPGNATCNLLTLIREHHVVRLQAARTGMKLFPHERLGAVTARAVVGHLQFFRMVWRYKECYQRSWCLLSLPGGRWEFFRWHLALPLHLCYRVVRKLAMLAASATTDKGRSPQRTP